MRFESEGAMPGMLRSVSSEEVRAALRVASESTTVELELAGRVVRVPTPFPSPEDWRDQWIYFLLVDRFDNPRAAPRRTPFDGEHNLFQGGTFEGIRRRLPYLAKLGVGALWLSPVLKNCAYEESTYHGYGIQDFLRVEPRFTSDPSASRQDPERANRELRRLVDEAHAHGLYVIFDIVLNHAGNVFDYDGHGAEAPFRTDPYPIHWRDGEGVPSFPDLATATRPLDADSAVWPEELQRNELFRRKGRGGEAGGDFASLKELVTDFRENTAFGPKLPAEDALIRAYQYAVARFDVDGFRIDTLKFIEPSFARTFGNAMREFALSLGKRDFFTFGEVFDGEDKIAEFIGRDARATGDPIGVDAALDFPLFFALPGVAKGFAPPVRLSELYARRVAVQRGLVTSHGEASGHFVTFLDNHDMRERFFFAGEGGRFTGQVTLGLACLFALQGLPCLYYGTEQGLSGRGDSDRAVREALWGQPNAFDETHPFYLAVQRLAELRARHPALRYGRQYFRPISGDGVGFGISPFAPGVLAFSRILNHLEVVLVANASTTQGFRGEVIVDASLNPDGARYEVAFSNLHDAREPRLVETKAAGSVRIQDPNGNVSNGPARVLSVDLRPMEAQILTRRS
jgi:glycosidase